jgi:hypothetical protein
MENINIYENVSDRYWFPKPFWPPQSGHSQVIPLQDIPQKFSSMQSWHMANPHLHLQQNRAAFWQQLQLISLAFSRFCRYEDLIVESVMFRYFLKIFSIDR